jgi:hypothetical protein
MVTFIEDLWRPLVCAYIGSMPTFTELHKRYQSGTAGGPSVVGGSLSSARPPPWGRWLQWPRCSPSSSSSPYRQLARAEPPRAHTSPPCCRCGTHTARRHPLDCQSWRHRRRILNRQRTCQNPPPGKRDVGGNRATRHADASRRTKPLTSPAGAPRLPRVPRRPLLLPALTRRSLLPL